MLPLCVCVCAHSILISRHTPHVFVNTCSLAGKCEWLIWPFVKRTDKNRRQTQNASNRGRKETVTEVNIKRTPLRTVADIAIVSFWHQNAACRPSQSNRFNFLCETYYVYSFLSRPCCAPVWRAVALANWRALFEVNARIIRPMRFLTN